MIKRIVLSITLLLSIFSVCTSKPHVVGYIMGSGENFDQKFSTLRWNYLTHLNVAFLLVDQYGNLSDTGFQPHLANIIETAHQNSVKVLVSLQSDGDKGFYKAVKDTQIRKKLVRDILKYVKKNNLDGFDLDYELYDHICPELILFAKELYQTKEKKVLQTCAVPHYNPDAEGGYTDKWHKYFDFINIMTYDFTGPWAKEGQHAPFQQVEDGVKNWTEILKAPRKKLVIGLPFYGYSWDGKVVTSFSYEQILTQHADKLTPNDDVIGHTYFNGETTIRKKCRYIMDSNLGGVMIWQLFHDAEDEDKQLMKVVHEELLKD